jgi:hypothetical protein
VTFTVDGIGFDQFADNGDPAVYDAPTPAAVALAAQVTGFPADQALFDWEIRPFLATGTPPWQDMADCPLSPSTSCSWDATDEFFDVGGSPTPVCAARVRLRVQACAGAVDLTVGPTVDVNGGAAFVDVAP